MRPVSSRGQIVILLSVYVTPGGFTLHMTGYAPACTKSIEKGRFLDIRRRRRLFQKGIIFAANHNLGVLKWVELFRAENRIQKQHFENLCKIVKKHDMRFVFIWNIKENEVWYIRISSFSVEEKLQKLLRVNTDTRRHLGIKFQTWHHLHKYAFKGRFLVNDAI